MVRQKIDQIYINGKINKIKGVKKTFTATKIEITQ